MLYITKEEQAMEMYRNEVVNKILSWKGKNEDDGSFKSIIDLYNTIKPRPRGVKLKYTDEWCAPTVSAVFHELGYDSICPLECSCGRMVAKAQSMGIWVENDAYVPSAGDIIMYDWNDNGIGDDTGWPDHVGIVTNVSNSRITVTEGNNSRAVGQRVIGINNKYIRGYIVPKYTQTCAPIPKPIAPAVPSKPSIPAQTNGGTFDMTIRSLHVGMKGKDVMSMQAILKAKGYDPNGIDGIYGKGCKASVEKFQHDHNFAADGICGPNTWNALINS